MSQLNELFEQQKFAEAITFCKKQILENPSNDNYYNLGLAQYHYAYQKEGDIQNEALAESKNTFLDLLQKYQNEHTNITNKLNNVFDVAMYLVEIHFALQQFKETRDFINLAFDSFPYNYEANYRLASLAYEIGSYDITGKIATQYFSFTSLYDELDQGELLDKLYDLYQKGLHNEDILFAIALTYRNSDYGHIDSFDETLNELIDFISKYPKSVLLHGALGNLFYFEGDFETALGYYEKTLGSSQASPNWYARYIFSHIYVKGTAPSHLPEIATNDALSIYSGASILTSEGGDLQNSPFYDFIAQTKIKWLEQSYNLFNEFFTKGLGSSFCFNEHWFSMCCNDYGIELTNKKEYTKAVDAFRTGFHFSIYPAILISALRCANEMRNGNEILYFYNIYDNEYGVTEKNLGTRFFFEVRAIKMYADEYLNIDEVLRKNDIETFLTQVRENEHKYLEAFQDYYTYYVETISYLEEKLVAISANLNVSPEENYALQQAIAHSKKFPNDDSNWYVLFQAQHAAGLYEDCINSANEYERSSFVMGSSIANYERASINYRKGSSFVRTGKAHEGVPLLLEAEKYTADGVSYWVKHDLALGYLDLFEMEKAENYLDYCINHYRKENLSWDNEIEILCRKALKIMDAQNNKKWVKKIADFVLENINDDEIKALKKKYSNMFGF